MKTVKIGNLILGDKREIYVQSMLSTRRDDIDGAILQAKNLEAAGCRILRLAVPDVDSVNTVYALKKNIGMPIVADIHFDYKLALECVAAGVDKIRINPGNIGNDEKVHAVARACSTAGVPIRIGVNGGSLEKNILAKYGGPTEKALVESALYHVSLLEKFDFDDIVISIKSSDVKTMINAYRSLASLCNYPLHLGVTEAGTYKMGVIKNAIGIGALLADGIGDTIRVSLTAEPVLEVKAGYDILRALGLCKTNVQFISCPTCGRCQIDLIPLAERIEAALEGCKKNIKVAVMGCAVNGPGEAREADIGIAGGRDEGLIFKKGEILRKVPYDRLFDELMKEIDKL